MQSIFIMSQKKGGQSLLLLSFTYHLQFNAPVLQSEVHQFQVFSILLFG